MKSIHRTLQRLALAALTATAFLSQAEAAPVVSISPATQTIGVGASTSIDIMVSGLTNPTGGFAMVLNYSNSFLTGLNFSVDPDGKMGTASDLSFGFGTPGPGQLDLFVLADRFASQAALAASEGAAFRLATVSFQGLANGLSPLTFSGLTLSNFDGTADIAGVGSVNGSICVGGDCSITTPVPEPETYLLFAAGLATLAVRRRRAAK